MSELERIQSTPSPRTRESIAKDLRAMGLTAGMTVLVHSSMSRLGWVCGGPVAIVQALMDVVTEEGTLVMPTHSADLTDPAGWQNPPVPESWWQEIRDTMPAFDPHLTPTRSMGRIVEVFRTVPGTVRSQHPHFSFAAWGKHKEQITCGHLLEEGLGEGSPLARLYELDGQVLLLGVGYGNNTCFHLAEHRAPGAVRTEISGPVIEEGRRVWKVMPDIEMDADRFPMIGVDFEQAEPVQQGDVGSAPAKLFSLCRAVDFATSWLTAIRKE